MSPNPRLDGPVSLIGRPPEAAELPEGVTTLAAALQDLVAILPGLKAALERQAAPPVDRMTLRLDELEAALGVSRRLIQKEIAAGRFPRPIKCGRTSLWLLEAIREHLAQQAAGGRRVR
ncbi:MAG TPA: hypothetical protein VFF52_11995 [Isosphaeraceae bacterium]|nr:hypothetical protein [Isosphaeraceae bacterium]